MTDDALGTLGDIPPDQLRAHLHRMADWIADYRETIEQRHIVPRVEPGDITRGTDEHMPQQGEPMSRILDELDSVVMPGIVHWGHPAFVGYFGSTSNGPALLGEMAAAALNVSAMTWKTSPAATELETVVLKWVQESIGLDAGLTGIVYDTASVGVLHALAAAREAAGSDVRARGVAGRPDVRVHRVYASDQAHSSLEKAIVLLGLGEENVVRIPTDSEFRMDVAALRHVVQADVARGFLPMAVVATVGTTSTASVDPVPAIAGVCSEFRMWLHVDAAYGGAMGMLSESHSVLGGTERADSVVVNPHKWLFVPLDFSMLFIRRPDVLRSVFALTPEYLRGDAGAAADRGAAINYMDYGIQLGRRFRALKAWMAFRAMGSDGIASRIREHCRLAAHFAALVRAEPNFELTAPQNMGVVCFRIAPPNLSDQQTDILNEAIVAAVNASGAAYITHTRLRERICMRIGIGNVLTTEKHVDAVWARILVEACRLSETLPPDAANNASPPSGTAHR
jgi:aromatic-L-amino-acid decarboxylase